MARKYYGASSAYGVNVTYDSPGWSVHVFEDKKSRDAWVGESPNREVITLANAKRIAWWYEEPSGNIIPT